MLLTIVLLIIAVVLFVIASVTAVTSRINLVALGLAFFAASFLPSLID